LLRQVADNKSGAVGKVLYYRRYSGGDLAATKATSRAAPLGQETVFCFVGLQTDSPAGANQLA